MLCDIETYDVEAVNFTFESLGLVANVVILGGDPEAIRPFHLLGR